MDPVVVLRKLVDRLEKKVWSIHPDDFVAFVDTPEAAVLDERGLAGKLHLAEAYRMAREALESGDRMKIAKAMLICPTLERTGLELERKHAAATRQRTSGKARGKQQSADAAARWKPYVKQFQDLVAAGKPVRVARELVRKMMVKDGFTLPGADSLPNGRTIRKWLAAVK